MGRRNQEWPVFICLVVLVLTWIGLQIRTTVCPLILDRRDCTHRYHRLQWTKKLNGIIKVHVIPLFHCLPGAYQISLRLDRKNPIPLRREGSHKAIGDIRPRKTTAGNFYALVLGPFFAKLAGTRPLTTLLFETTVWPTSLIQSNCFFKAKHRRDKNGTSGILRCWRNCWIKGMKVDEWCLDPVILTRRILNWDLFWVVY